MPALTQFILGALHNDFMQMKTTDNIYLKDLLEQEISPSLDLYNNRTMAMKSLLCYEQDNNLANIKKMYSNDGFKRIGAIEKSRTRTQFDSWNRPIPIIRYGSATMLVMETLKQMSSKQIIEFHNSKLIADHKNVVKTMFERMCTKTPSSEVDAITSIAATPKAFWNDEASMDTPRSNGQITFDGDHNHYVYPGTADSLGSNGTELDTLIAKITEHEDMNGQVILWARTGATLNLIMNESTNFKHIKEVSSILGLVNPAYNTSGFVQAMLNGSKVLGYNVRAVGVWKNCIVVETPDLPEYYILATMYLSENSNLSALGWRNHSAFKGLMITSESGNNPLIGNDAEYRRYLAVGVWNRSAGAALYTHSDSEYTEPTFN